MLRTDGSTNPKPSVAIIGGGYAGMAAAVTLAANGVRCVVFEAGRTLGGRARRIEHQGEVIDNGQHILAGAYTELLRLMRLVEVPDSALRRVPLRLSMPPEFLLSAPRNVLLRGSVYLGWTLLATKGLSFSEKLAAIRFMRSLQRSKFKVDASTSVATLLAQHRQPGNLIDHLWQPLTISALNTPLSDASAQVFANVLRDSLASNREASDLLLPCIDLTALFPDPASAWITARGSKVRTRASVSKIVEIESQYRVISNDEVQHFDSVILAVGPHQLAGLMQDIDAPSLKYEPIVTIYFRFEANIQLSEPMLGQTRGFAQWFFDRRALNAKCSLPTEGGGLIAAVISASGPHQLLSQGDLADRVFVELSRHVPELPAPLWRKVVTEKFATFACTPNANRPPVITRYRGVYRAGDYVAGEYPATLEGAVRNGITAAEASIAYLQTI